MSFTFEVLGDSGWEKTPHKVPQKEAATSIAVHLLRTYPEVRVLYNDNLLNSYKRDDI